MTFRNFLIEINNKAKGQSERTLGLNIGNLASGPAKPANPHQQKVDKEIDGTLRKVGILKPGKSRRYP
jgi:hypothetical protein